MNPTCIEHNFCRSKSAIFLCDCCHKALDALDHEHEFWVAANCSLVKQNDKLLNTLKQFKWISVKDKLPEIGIKVIALEPIECLVVTAQRCRDPFDDKKEYWQYRTYFSGEIAYWMELPALPEEKPIE